MVEEETRRSQQAARDKQSPSQANGCGDHRPIDILEMLSRAKDEYERVRLCAEQENQSREETSVGSGGLGRSPPGPAGISSSERRPVL